MEEFQLIALFLFAISWMLNPHPGFSGLSQLWSSYVLNMGTPFEEWLTGLSQLAQQHATPDEFLETALVQFGELPWVEGARWTAEDSAGLTGRETGHANVVRGDALEVTVYTLAAPGATLLLHSRLLVQVIDYYYAAKRAQQELANRAHLQAVHETGARVTHDIKNLLQSLQTLTLAMEQTEGARAEQAFALVKRQLPQLGQRLGRAVDKLQSPEVEEPAETLALEAWWQRAVQRHQEEGFSFAAEGELAGEIRADILDTVLENLLENARFKRQSEPDIDIAVRLMCGPPLTISVCDSGSPIPEPIESRLLRQPVESTSGLGIGLYQTARLARRGGCRLVVERNEAGRVCFELREDDNPVVSEKFTPEPAVSHPHGAKSHGFPPAS